MSAKIMNHGRPALCAGVQRLMGETCGAVKCFTSLMEEAAADPLAMLSMEERMACRVAERVTGGKARPWDVPPRQGVVDAFLDFDDGRKAAFEITRPAAVPTALQFDRVLFDARRTWKLPGKWCWTINVGELTDMPRLRSCYAKVILLCEAEGVTRPEDLQASYSESVDPDLEWVVRDSSAAFNGYPGVPAWDGEKLRRLTVLDNGIGGMVDEQLAGFGKALVSMFESPNLRKHVTKLVRAEADEHHLFLIMHETDMDESVMMEIMTGSALPPGPGWLPHGVSHLWLASNWSNRVLISFDGAWHQEFPYDN
ncbi:hypothetical protein [Actinokineospora bangkokensis]|uniref:Uncharacterized protein n=1 Tax=Actinokineospora bangkokensis TaxID=1193682 RepID=A0A1Q9LFN4_9PSEU|nr:hypothetical protein [Actinokineospora bangkokensis]OLR90838.1 hypothetical protein BJP25_30190 [Actinokineospora bangkokensis]